LYELVYNETLAIKDIEIQTLESTVLYRARYNDISFVSSEETQESSVSFVINEDTNKDKLLLVLVEH